MSESLEWTKASGLTVDFADIEALAQYLGVEWHIAYLYYVTRGYRSDSELKTGTKPAKTKKTYRKRAKTERRKIGEASPRAYKETVGNKPIVKQLDTTSYNERIEAEKESSGANWNASSQDFFSKLMKKGE